MLAGRTVILTSSVFCDDKEIIERCPGPGRYLELLELGFTRFSSWRSLEKQFLVSGMPGFHLVFVQLEFLARRTLEIALSALEDVN